MGCAAYWIAIQDAGWDDIRCSRSGKRVSDKALRLSCRRERICVGGSETQFAVSNVTAHGSKVSSSHLTAALLLPLGAWVASVQWGTHDPER
jgi:hypothetical protein